MPVKIRLMRIGAKKRPFYRIVAVDERQKRTGKYLELLGTYNPLTEPKEIILKKDRIELWLKQGAVMSDGYLRMTKQAPQRPPRKPKKEKKDKVPTPTPEVISEPAKEEPTAEPAQEEPAKEEPAAAEPENQEEAAVEAEKVEEPAVESQTEEAKPDEEPKPEIETKK